MLRVLVAQDTRTISRLYEKFQKHRVLFLQLSTNKEIDVGCCTAFDWTAKKDVNYHLKKIQELNDEISHAKRSIQATPTAFVQFLSLKGAAQCAGSHLYESREHFLSRLAPYGHDVIWNNLHYDSNELILNYLISSILVIIVVVLFTFLTTLVPVISNIDTFFELFNIDISHHLPGGTATMLWVQGVMPSLILALWLNWLPSILYRLVLF